MLKMHISLLIGLIFIDTGLCQVFETPGVSSDDDLTASAATLFGPKTFGIGHANLGNFGPLGYGGIGGMRLGSIGPLHFGHIGGIHADSFLGAPNPNADAEESHGSIGTPSGSQYNENVGSPLEKKWEGLDSQQNIVGMEQSWQGLNGQENWQGIHGQNNMVGMEQRWQGFNGEPNFVGLDGQGMQPNALEWNVGLQPQIKENARAFLNDGLFGLKKIDKIEKIPHKPAPPPKFPKHPPKLPPPPPPPPPPPTYDYYGGYGSHSHGHGSYHGSHHGSHSSHGSGSSGYGYRSYGGHGYNERGPHFNSQRPYRGDQSGIFRNDLNEFERMAPQGYQMNGQSQEFYEIKNAMQVLTTTNQYQPNIILVEKFPSSRSSARSSVDNVLTGLADIGFDFEFRDLIENVFLRPYLGLLDPNNLDDDTLLIL